MSVLFDAGRKITPKGGDSGHQGRHNSGLELCPSMLLDGEGDEIDNVQDEIPVPVVLDSGAGDHVSDNMDAFGYVVEPSPGSRAGRGFIAANGAKIPNRGQMKLSLKTEDGRPIKFVSRSARRAGLYGALGGAGGSGCKVVFDSAKAEVVRKSTGKTSCTFQRSGVCTSPIST